MIIQYFGVYFCVIVIMGIVYFKYKTEYVTLCSRIMELERELNIEKLDRKKLETLYDTLLQTMTNENIDNMIADVFGYFRTKKVQMEMNSNPPPIGLNIKDVYELIKIMISKPQNNDPVYTKKFNYAQMIFAKLKVSKKTLKLLSQQVKNRNNRVHNLLNHKQKKSPYIRTQFDSLIKIIEGLTHGRWFKYKTELKEFITLAKP